MKNVTQALPDPATTDRLSIRQAWVLYSIYFGASVTEAVSVNLLPLTLALYTREPDIIFWILAINPAFGLITQPIVGLLSDRVWTRIGRRALFLILAAPVVACNLVLIPFLGTLLTIVVSVVLLQFFQDVINGTDQPLIADLVPPNRRTLVLGLVKAAENIGFLLVLFFGMPLVEEFQKANNDNYYGLPMYVIAAFCQILFVAIPAFFLGEKMIQKQNRPRLTLTRYLSDFFSQPLLVRIASAYFLRSFSRSAVVGSVALYAHHTLRLSEGSFGAAWGMMPCIALTTGIPLGLMAENHAKHRVLQLGFLLLIVACVFGYFIPNMPGLIIASLIFGIGDILMEVTHKAFMSDFYPADLVGQLSGSVNCFYAMGRIAGLICVGQIVRFYNPSINWDAVPDNAVVNYDAIWLVSSASSLIGIVILNFTRDLRYESQLKENRSQ